MRRTVAVAVAVAAASAVTGLGAPAGHAAAPGVPYTVVVLETLGGGANEGLSGACPRSINDAGQLAGTAVLPAGGFAPVWWDADGHIHDDIHLPSKASGNGGAINRAGDVAGADESGAGFVWDHRTGQVKTLSPPAPIGFVTYVPDIDDRGQVAGVGARSFIYAPTGGGVWTDLGTIPGFLAGVTARNEAGDAVGNLGVSSPFAGDRAFLWRASTGTMTDLGTLGPVAAGANDINDRGQIVGAHGVDAADPTLTHGYLRQPDGSITDLPPPSSKRTAGAAALNEAGIVVGSATDGPNDQAGAPLVWYGNGAPAVLPLPDRANQASTNGINEAGVIAGCAMAGSELIPVRWDPPVPPPPTTSTTTTSTTTSTTIAGPIAPVPESGPSVSAVLATPAFTG